MTNEPSCVRCGTALSRLQIIRRANGFTYKSKNGHQPTGPFCSRSCSAQSRAEAAKRDGAARPDKVTNKLTDNPDYIAALTPRLP